MQTKSKKMLPKITSEIENGGVYAQAVRCGKSNCKCARGEHHTAFYFFTRRHGKLVKLYVRQAEVEAFAGMVKRATAERRRKRQAVKSSAELLSKFRADLCKNDALIKNFRGNKDYE